MPGIIPSSLRVILPLIVQKIVGDGVFADPSLCYVADTRGKEDLYYPPGQQFCTIVAGGSRAWSDGGGGRAFKVLDQEVAVVTWTRYAMEMAGRSYQVQTDEALGITDKLLQLIDALEEFFPTDSDGNLCTVEGLKLEREDDLVRQKGSEEWSRRRQFYRFPYQVSLTGINNPLVS